MKFLLRAYHAFLVLIGKIQITIDHEIGATLMALTDDITALGNLIDSKLAAHASALQAAQDRANTAEANAQALQAQIDAATAALAAETAKINAA